jgi:hypothetical protein
VARRQPEGRWLYIIDNATGASTPSAWEKRRTGRVRRTRRAIPSLSFPNPVNPVTNPVSAVTVRPVLDRVSCFADLLLEDRDEAFAALRGFFGDGVFRGRRVFRGRVFFGGFFRGGFFRGRTELPLMSVASIPASQNAPELLAYRCSPSIEGAFAVGPDHES